MKKHLILTGLLALSQFAAAQPAEKKFLFKLKSVTCRLDNGQYITASCKYLDGRSKGPCSIVHIDTSHENETYVTSEELTSGKAHVAMVGEKQYVTFSQKANGATVCYGYGNDGDATEIIITGELLDKVTYSDIGKPELDKK